ncbi:MAG TPA: LysR family transcriptional regulator [Veillonellaceae bacterium]|nr:LysR family transcriptional regulator [Veillonellaceae bacterium]
MDIKQLRYFVAIIEEGTITGAAKLLHVSQPPLSNQMRLLENELGAELFRRGARHVTLTEAGEVLYRYAVEILELENVAKEEIGSMRAGQKGNLRLGLVSSCASEELYRELRLFHKEFPDVHVKLFEGNTYEQMEMLRKGKVDVAVLRTPFPSYGLERVTIRRDRMAVAAARGVLPRTHGDLTLKALEKKPVIIYRRWEKLILDEFEKEMAVPEVYCVTDDARTSLQWAEAGIGIAIVPESILSWGKNLEMAFLSERNLSSSLSLVKRRGQIVSRVAESFFRFFKDEEERAAEEKRMREGISDK